MSSIQEYNNELINSLTKLDLIEYFNYIHSNFYNNIDISFMEYFLSLVNKDNEFCVDGEKIIEYGVITTDNKSNDVLKCLKRNKLIENEDYRLRQLAQQSNSSRGIKYKKKYKLTPWAFKMCLIRSYNTNIYANYYLVLETVFKNFNDYQLRYQNKLLSNKDEKIDNLNKKMDKQSKKMDKQSKKMDEQSKQIEELLGYAKNTKESLDDVKEQNDDLHEQNEGLNEKVDNLHETMDNLNEQNEGLNEKVDDLNETMDTLHETVNNMAETVDELNEKMDDMAENHVPPTVNPKKHKYYILLQNKDELNKFIFKRGSLNNIKNYNEETYNLILQKNNPNPINLLDRVKEYVKNLLNITIKPLNKEEEINKLLIKKLKNDTPYIDTNYKKIVSICKNIKINLINAKKNKDTDYIKKITIELCEITKIKKSLYNLKKTTKQQITKLTNLNKTITKDIKIINNKIELKSNKITLNDFTKKELIDIINSCDEDKKNAD